MGLVLYRHQLEREETETWLFMVLEGHQAPSDGIIGIDYSWLTVD